MLPRGAGTSQCGQTVGAALVIDHTQAPEPGHRVRRGGAHRRSSQPGVVLDHAERVAAAARPVVPGRRLDQRAGDDRRHGGQQLVRLALDRLRQHGAQRARHRRGAADGRALALRRRWTIASRPPAYRELVAGCARYRSARSEEIERAFRRCCAASRGYNLDHLGAAARQRGAPAGGLRGHARLFRAAPPQALAAAGAQERSACATSRPSTPRWTRTQHIVKLGPVRGGAGRPHDDRARARASRRSAPTVDAFIRGEPDAILLVEFAGDDAREQLRKLKRARRS